MQDEILRLIPEPANSVDINTVAVMKEGQIVGHVPFNLAPIISLFLRRDVNKSFARVTGGKVNRGAVYGLEKQCVYQFYGPKALCLLDKRSLLLQNSVTNSVGSSSSEDELDPILRNAPPVARYDKLREPLVETH